MRLLNKHILDYRLNKIANIVWRRVHYTVIDKVQSDELNDYRNHVWHKVYVAVGYRL